MNEEIKIAGIYIRVSTEDQSQNSNYGTKPQELYKIMKGMVKMLLKNNSETVKK